METKTEVKTITIHRALSELKLIDSKITKQITEIQPVGIHQKGKLINGHIKEEDFKKDAQSKYDSIVALIDRKVALKKAIVASNAKTEITILEKKMTVADAISYKEAILFKKQFVTNLGTKHNQVVMEMNKKNDVISTRLQSLLEASLGKDNVKTGSDEVAAISKPFNETNEFLFFNPLTLKDKLDVLTKEIDDFEANVDASLSESNAVTTIEI